MRCEVIKFDSPKGLQLYLNALSTGWEIYSMLGVGKSVWVTAVTREPGSAKPSTSEEAETHYVVRWFVPFEGMYIDVGTANSYDSAIKLKNRFFSATARFWAGVPNVGIIEVEGAW